MGSRRVVQLDDTTIIYCRIFKKVIACYIHLISVSYKILYKFISTPRNQVPLVWSLEIVFEKRRNE